MDHRVGPARHQIRFFEELPVIVAADPVGPKKDPNGSG
jgi:hypothetical protein